MLPTVIVQCSLDASSKRYIGPEAGFHTGIFGGGWGGWEKFVGYCHSVMHEFAARKEQRLYKFSSFLREGGGN